jgi:DNA-3-methyladenine glycosylase II
MQRHLTIAVPHLRGRDPVLRRVIDVAGPCTLRPRRDRFEMLAGSILAQQLSTAAARTIRSRLVERAGGRLAAEPLLALSDEEFRLCGVSAQKAGYLRDLASRVASGSLPMNQLGRLSDEEVIERLTVVKGVGRWTAQMFLIFALGRPDVLPHDDLGIRNAIRRLYGLPEMPRRDEVDRIAEPWRPYASVASWYLWRSLDGPAG